MQEEDKAKKNIEYFNKFRNELISRGMIEQYNRKTDLVCLLDNRIVYMRDRDDFIPLYFTRLGLDNFNYDYGSYRFNLFVCKRDGHKVDLLEVNIGLIFFFLIFDVPFRLKNGEKFEPKKFNYNNDGIVITTKGNDVIYDYDTLKSTLIFMIKKDWLFEDVLFNGFIDI